MRQKSVPNSRGKLCVFICVLSFVVGCVAYEGVEPPEARTPSDTLSGLSDSTPAENSNEQQNESEQISGNGTDNTFETSDSDSDESDTVEQEDSQNNEMLGDSDSPSADLEATGTDGSDSGFSVNTENEVRWEAPSATDGHLEIFNSLGNLTVRPSTHDVLKIIVTKQSQGGDLTSTRIEIVEHEDGVTVCVIHDQVDPQYTPLCLPGFGLPPLQERSDVAHDFIVEIPSTMTLHAVTEEGAISAVGIVNDAVLYTTTGPIDVQSSADVSATTFQGTVTARLDRLSANEDGLYDLSSLSGDVLLSLSTSDEFTIYAATLSGQIESDFQGIVDEFQNYEAEVNGGGVLVNAGSVSGDIRILTLD